ncbi:hypothetical protein R5R35_007448 [Gryllus longicercus]|uniref:Serine/threonine-protein phosphatase 2A activator n=1 Tax=Gryllus longicercus TaxID=2509291 RepID=A0AAN9V9B5_9ORTH
MDHKIDLTKHQFKTPCKGVYHTEDMRTWESSKAYRDIVGLMLSLNDAVKGVPLTSECQESDNANKIIALLKKLDQWINETPPSDQPQRFGNRAFKDWYGKLTEGSQQLLMDTLPEELHSAIPELHPYLTEGFGNSTRIDYGTGHEMCFLMLICCFYKIGILNEDDNVAVVNKIFNTYLHLVRKLQTTYNMEPAGSHGVWNLDDYQFLPFLWGSAQLIEHERLVPKTYLNPNIVQQHANQFMFMDSIKFINEVKRGPFSEHSNLLWNISNLESWANINSGLIKMYKVEVLGKFPVIQHVVFGSLLEITRA